MSKKHKVTKSSITQKPKGINLSDRKIFLILLIVFFIGIVLLYNPNLFTEGGGGDDASYIILAKSLLQGSGYRDILDPNSPPHVQYPPGFPLILIPGIILFDDNFAILKFIIIALSLGAFVIFYQLLKKKGEQSSWIFPLTIFAVSPIILEYSHWLLSEIPYLFFSLLAVYLFEKFSNLKKKNIIFFILMAVSVAFVYFVRTIGMSLVLACLIYLLYKKRWKELIVLAVIVGIFIIPWQIRNSIVGGHAGGYFQQFLAKSPYESAKGNINFFEYLNRIFTNFELYSFSVVPQILFPLVTTSGLLTILGLVSLFFLILGFVKVIKKKSLGLWEIYTIFFIAVTLSWPKVWSGDRFFIPIIPFIFYYIFIGLNNFNRWIKLKSFSFIILGLMVILAIADSVKKIPTSLNNLSTYLKGEKYASYEIIWQRYFETLDWIKNNTEKDAIIVSRKPPFTYLLGQRKSILHLRSTNIDSVYMNMSVKKANYILYDAFSDIRQYVGPLINAYPDKFELVYKSTPPEMYVFKIK
jgi:hypothetical protein